MRIPTPWWALRAAACATFVAAAHAQNALDDRPFPLEVTHRRGLLGTLELAPRSQDLTQLLPLDSVTFRAVPVTAHRTVDLALERVPLDFSRTELWVDGVRVAAGLDSGDLSVWKGRVVGATGSDVVLAFSSFGSHGWIHDGVELVHLLAAAGPGNDWSHSIARFVPESVLLSVGEDRGPFCAFDELQDGPGSSYVPITPESTSMAGTGSGVTLACTMAVETDYQYYQEFNNLNAAQNYTLTLLAAKSDRIAQQIDVVLTYPYLAFYTSANDPWSSPDSSNNDTGDLLNEFRNAWEGNIPSNANLAHFLSGASLGGGIAYLDVLCNEDYAFAVSANLSGGVDFPATQSSGNWDFMVTMHETGHNIGSTHTHNYCPPLDQCASSNYWGQCQNSTQCISNGTVMSYCHTCTGGTANITLYYHPVVNDVLRTQAENSCLAPLIQDPAPYCETSANSASAAGSTLIWAGSYSLAANDLEILALDTVPFAFGLFYYGPEQIQEPFGDGFRCVGAGATGLVRFGAAAPADVFGASTLSLDVTQPPANSGAGEILAGSTWNFQYWFRDQAGGGGGFNLSNGLSVGFLP